VYTSLAITFLAGTANALIFIPTQTILQANVSHKSLSKIYGLLYLAVGVLAFIPIIMAGVFADVLGVRFVLLGIGLALFAVAFAKVFLFKNHII
jgi:MFS family permease